MTLSQPCVKHDQTIKILVADDHTLVAEGIERLLLECFQHVDVVTSGELLVSSILLLQPDVVVTDISMPDLNGIEAMRILRKDGCTTPFIFLTMHAESAMAAQAVNAGASAYVLKSSAGEELVFAIREVLQNRTYVTPSLAVNAIISSGHARYSLTEKQIDILQHVALGMRPKEIAFQLGISVRTVESHKYAIMQELGVHGTVELVRKAQQEGLITG